MAVSDYASGYGGTQSGNERIEIDPETGQQIIVRDDIEVSPNSRHQSVGAALGRTAGQVVDPRQSLLPYLLPYAAWAGGTAAGTGAVSGAAEGSVPSHMAGAVPSGLPTTTLPGITPAVSAPPWAPTFASGVTAPAATGATGAAAAPAAAAPVVADHTLKVPLQNASTSVPNMPGQNIVGGPNENWMSGWKGDLLGGAIEAGVGLWGAKRTSDAAKEAARIQTAAGDRAVAATKQALDPYMTLGSASANTLGGLMGLPMGGAPVMGGTTLSDVGPRPEGPSNLPLSEGNWQRKREAVLGSQVARDLQPARAQQQSQSSYVRMADDSGQTVNVPAARVAEFERLGARRMA